jgi:hypothetical protein
MKRILADVSMDSEEMEVKDTHRNPMFLWIPRKWKG